MRIRLVLASLILTALVPFVAFADGPQTPKEWTILVFLNGDNNLDSAGVKDVNEMEKVGSSDQVNVVVQHDRSGNTGTKRYLIKKDENDTTITSPVVVDMPECDMGNWQEAVKFFNWGADTYPAKKYLLAIWDHGAGWEKKPNAKRLLKGISYDDQSGNHITTPQLGQIVKDFSEHIGRKTDIFSYDACLMQMAEVAHEVKNHTVIQVGSEETEPADGWPYDAFLSQLAAKPAMDARECASVLVKTYVDSYNGGSQGRRKGTLSAIDLTRFDEFMVKLNAFSDALIANASSNAAIQSVASSTQSYAYSQYKDLGDFTTKLMAKLTVPEIQTAGQDMLKFYNEQLMIKNAFTGTEVAGSTGMSIYIPTKSQFNNQKQAYAGLTWAQAGKWDEFLLGLHYPNVPVISVKEIGFIDDNGAINPGDELTFKVKLSNDGTKDSGALTVSLSSDSPNATVTGQPVTVDKVPGLATVETPPVKAKILDTCPSDTSLTFTASVKDADGKEYTGAVKVTVKAPFLVKNKVLLVAIDANDANAKFYTKALQDAGIGFDLYSIKYYGTPSTALFQNYVNGTVVFNAPGTSDLSQLKVEDLSSYLDKGGSLFITGQDVGYSLKNKPFLADYLHAKFVQDTSGSKELVGEGVLANVTGKIEGGDGANNQRWPDEIDPISPAVAILKYKKPATADAPASTNPVPTTPSAGSSTEDLVLAREPNTRGLIGSGTAGIAVATGTYKIVYLAFGFEGLDSAELRKTVMAKALAYLAPTATDRIRGLTAVAERNRKLYDSNGHVAYSSARSDEAEWVERSAPFFRALDPKALPQELKENAVARDLLRAVTFENLAR